MANYPAFPQMLGSERITFDDMTVDRAIDGTGRGRAFYTGRKNRFHLRHVLRQADWETLLAFYDANRTLAIGLTFDGDQTFYTGLVFSAPPKITYVGAGWIGAEVDLEAL